MALLDDIRAQNPSYALIPDELLIDKLLLEYRGDLDPVQFRDSLMMEQPLPSTSQSPETLPIPGSPMGFGSDPNEIGYGQAFTSGVKSMWERTWGPGITYLRGGIAGLAGKEDRANAFYQQAREQDQEISSRTPYVTYDQAVNGPDAGVDTFVKFGLQQAGMSLPYTIGGGVAGLAGKALLKNVIGKTAGTITGATTAFVPQTAAFNLSRQYEQVEMGNLDEVNERSAFAYALPQSILESVMYPVLGKLFGPLNRTEFANVLNRASLGRIVKGTSIGSVTEALTEVGQQALERKQAGLPIDSEDAIEEYKQAAAGAAFVGGLFGGATTIAGEGARAIQPKPETTPTVTPVAPTTTTPQLDIPITQTVAPEQQKVVAKEQAVQEQAKPLNFSVEKQNDKFIVQEQNEVGDVKPLGTFNTQEEAVAKQTLEQTQQNKLSEQTFFTRDEISKKYPNLGNIINDLEIESKTIAPELKQVYFTKDLALAEGNLSSAQSSGGTLGSSVDGWFDRTPDLAYISLADTTKASETVAHEAFHSLQRTMERSKDSLFKNDEITALNSFFPGNLTVNTIPQTVQSGLGKDVMNKLRERHGEATLTSKEMQAYAFGAYSSLKNQGKRLAAPNPIIRAFQRLFEFLKKAGNVFRKNDVYKVQDLFEKARTGEIGKRAKPVAGIEKLRTESIQRAEQAAAKGVTPSATPTDAKQFSLSKIELNEQETKYLDELVNQRFDGGTLIDDYTPSIKVRGNTLTINKNEIGKLDEYLDEFNDLERKSRGGEGMLTIPFKLRKVEYGKKRFYKIANDLDKAETISEYDADEGKQEFALSRVEFRKQIKNNNDDFGKKYGLKTSLSEGKKENLSKIGIALDKEHEEKYKIINKTPEVIKGKIKEADQEIFDDAVEAGYQEFKYQLELGGKKTSISGSGWYDKTITDTIERVKKILPQMNEGTPEQQLDKELQFKLFLALFSPQGGPEINLDVAVQVYKKYLETGIIPEEKSLFIESPKFGISHQSMLSSLKLVDYLVKKQRNYSFRDYLFTAQTYKELGKEKLNSGFFEPAKTSKKLNPSQLKSFLRNNTDYYPVKWTENEIKKGKDGAGNKVPKGANTNTIKTYTSKKTGEITNQVNKELNYSDLSDVNMETFNEETGKKEESQLFPAFMFGEKVGTFFLNFNGFEGVTKDRWFSRHYYRQFGQVGIARDPVTGKPKKLKTEMIPQMGGGKIKRTFPPGHDPVTKLRDTPQANDRKVMEIYVEAIKQKAITNGDLKGKDATRQNVQAILWYFEQGLYTDLGLESIPIDYIQASEALENKIKNDKKTGGLSYGQFYSKKNRSSNEIDDETSTPRKGEVDFSVSEGENKYEFEDKEFSVTDRPGGYKGPIKVSQSISKNLRKLIREQTGATPKEFAKGAYPESNVKKVQFLVEKNLEESYKGFQSNFQANRMIGIVAANGYQHPEGRSEEREFFFVEDNNGNLIGAQQVQISKFPKSLVGFEKVSKIPVSNKSVRKYFYKTFVPPEDLVLIKNPRSADYDAGLDERYEDDIKAIQQENMEIYDAEINKETSKFFKKALELDVGGSYNVRASEALFQEALNFAKSNNVEDIVLTDVVNEQAKRAFKKRGFKEVKSSSIFYGLITGLIEKKQELNLVAKVSDLDSQIEPQVEQEIAPETIKSDLELSVSSDTAIKDTDVNAFLKSGSDVTSYNPEEYLAAAETRGPLVGHCAACAYVVQKNYGGDVMQVFVPPKKGFNKQREKHYFNKLPDGTFIDLTGEQYGNQSVTPPQDFIGRAKIGPHQWGDSARYKGKLNKRFTDFEEKFNSVKEQDVVQEFSVSDLKNQVKKIDPSIKKNTETDVGKLIGGNLYVHKSAENVIDGLNNFKKRLPKDFTYDIVKFDKKENITSFIKSPDWDTAAEPLATTGVRVPLSGPIKDLKINQLYHHKWLFVRDDYKGFDSKESIKRSMSWLPLRKEGEVLDKAGWAAIGRPETWNKVNKFLDRQSMAKTARQRGEGLALPEAKVLQYLDANIARDEDVLSVGAGFANKEKELKDKGFNILAEDTKESGQEKRLNEAGLFEGYKEDFISEGRKFDTVLLSNVINVQNKIEAREELLNQVQQLLKPDGRLIINLPKNPQNPGSPKRNDELRSILEQRYEQVETVRINDKRQSDVFEAKNPRAETASQNLDDILSPEFSISEDKNRLDNPDSTIEVDNDPIDALNNYGVDIALSDADISKEIAETVQGVKDQKFLYAYGSNRNLIEEYGDPVNVRGSKIPLFSVGFIIDNEIVGSAQGIKLGNTAFIDFVQLRDSENNYISPTGFRTIGFKIAQELGVNKFVGDRITGSRKKADVDDKKVESSEFKPMSLTNEFDNLSQEERIESDLEFAVSDEKFSKGTEEFLKRINPEKQRTTTLGYWKKYSDNVGIKLKQGIIDQYSSIKKYIGEEPYKAVTMTYGAGGATESALMYGVPFLDKDGAIDLKENTLGTGLFTRLEKLGKDLPNFLAWVAANRADNLYSKGFETGLGDINNIKNAIKELSKGKEKLFNESLKDLNEFNEAFLKIGLESGYLSQAAYKKWTEDNGYNFYIPFYRILEGGEKNSTPKSADGVASQPEIQRYKGVNLPVQDLLSNIVANYNFLTEASLKNLASLKTLEQGEKMGVSRKVPNETKTSIFVRKDGKEVHYEVDNDLVLQSLQALNWEGWQNPAMGALRNFKRYLTFGVTFSPAFRIRNLIRDTTHSIAVADLSYNPLKNVLQGAKGLYKGKKGQSELRAKMGFGGGEIHFGHIYGNDPKATQMLLDRSIDLNTVMSSNGWSSGARKLLTTKLGKGLNWWNEVGSYAENINRAALYQQLRDKGVSHFEASYEARDLLNFSRHGASPAIRFLTQSIPFLNARIQGLSKLGTAMKPAQRAQLLTTLGTYSLASMALYLYYKDDEDYKAREQWDRDTYHWFKLPGDGMVFRMPRPFEVGAVGVIFERMLEQIVDDNVHGNLFAERLGHVITETFAFDLKPQAIKPIWEVVANKSQFTKRPIEPMWMKRLPKSERKYAYTSQAYSGAAAILNTVLWEDAEFSPVQIEHLVKGYLGWVGSTVATAVSISDYPRLAALYTSEDSPLFMNFFKPIPATGSKYNTEFYNMLSSMNETQALQRLYMNNGDTEKALEILNKNKNLLGWRQRYNKTNYQIQKISRTIKQTQSNKNLSEEDIRQRVKQLTLLKNKIIKTLREQTLSFEKNTGKRVKRPIFWK